MTNPSIKCTEHHLPLLAKKLAERTWPRSVNNTRSSNASVPPVQDTFCDPHQVKQLAPLLHSSRSPARLDPTELHHIAVVLPPEDPLCKPSGARHSWADTAPRFNLSVVPTTERKLSPVVEISSPVLQDESIAPAPRWSGASAPTNLGPRARRSFLSATS